MELQTENFLKLLGSVVHDNPVSELTAPVDWHALFSLAKAHNVLPLVFEQAGEDPAFQALPEYTVCRQMTFCSVVAQIRRTEAFLELYRAFLAEGLHPIVMKGIVCRQLYGNLSDHRPSGDEDLLIRKQDFQKARAVLEGQGYLTEHDGITLRQMDDLQEISFFHKESGLLIELHLNPMGHENAFRTQMGNCFQDVFQNYRELTIGSTVLRTMNHTDHFLFLVLHALKHFTVGGFGVRQILDILLYEEQFGEELNWDYLRDVLHRLDAYIFLSDLIHIGNRYLDFSLPVLCAPNCPEELLQEVMESGAFGNGTAAQSTAASLTTLAVSGRESDTVGQGSVKAALQVVFPSKQYFLNQYPKLQERPWLLPWCWVRRWFRFLGRGRTRAGRIAAEGMALSRRRVALLKKYGIM